MKENWFCVNVDGIEKKYYVEKIVKYKDNNYIIYKDDLNSEDYYSSKYMVVDNKIVLDEITSEDEWNYLEEELNKL